MASAVGCGGATTARLIPALQKNRAGRGFLVGAYRLSEHGKLSD
jgi:hypothetical protein